LRKIMLLAAMLAMVLVAAVPALAQSVTQVGSGNQACVQTAIQAEVGKVQISQYGDNVNIQNIAQECNVGVAQVEEAVARGGLNPQGPFHPHGCKPPAVAAAARGGLNPQGPFHPHGCKLPAVAAAAAPAAVQYQYAAPTASPAASPAAELPPTGGSSLIALGAGVLLVAGGLLARRVVR
jgi:hypothetical protein